MMAPDSSEPLMTPCIDYGRSFICTCGPENAPRFWVESRCRAIESATGMTVEYYQCASCKSENTFADSNLFMDPNYDFLPIFSEREVVIFRRHAWCDESYGRFLNGQATWGDAADPRLKYREVRGTEHLPIWGGMSPCLREVQARVLSIPSDMAEAAAAGLPLIGQTELCDEATGNRAILEYPVKTINLRPEEGLWQVDTGPVVLPDLSAPSDEWGQTLRLAFIAFNAPDWADLIFEQPTPIVMDGERAAWVYHYSGIVHMGARNVLLAQEEA